MRIGGEPGRMRNEMMADRG
jgi:hypothetical protein